MIISFLQYLVESRQCRGRVGIGNKMLRRGNVGKEKGAPKGAFWSAWVAGQLSFAAFFTGFHSRLLVA